KLINALTLANLRLGVRLFEWSPVQRIRHAIHPTIQTPAATIKASDVVLATNAYTPSLGYAGSAMLAMHHRVIVTRSLTDSEWELSGLERWPLRFEEGGYYTHTVRSTPDRR